MTERVTHMTDGKRREDGAGRGNRSVAIACAAFVVGMLGAAYASVPLYELFCRVTGYGGTTQVATSAEGVEVVDHEIDVRFDSNVHPHLPWSFAPDQRVVRVKLGELRTVTYRVKNLSDKPTVGTATFNVEPDAMGSYFSKIACFCFTQQRLEPGQELEMGVSFYVDPAMLDDADTRHLKSVTLSYTFFQATGPEKPVATAAPGKPVPNPS